MSELSLERKKVTWGYNKGCLLWTPREEQRLMNAYPLNARKWDSLKMLFPDRSRYAIIRRACDLKIKHKGSHWTHDEEELLLELKNKGLTYREMIYYFMYRTADGIKRKYGRLNKRKGF